MYALVQGKKLNEMNKKKNKGFIIVFDRFSTFITKITGKPGAFLSAMALIILWALSGPIFHFSDTWQLVINTSTTIITFLMVFVIQQSQNKDTIAIQLKLNELIAGSSFTSNRLIDAEELTTDELEVLKKFYKKLAVLSNNEQDIHQSHSIDEAKLKHERKKKIS